MTVSSSVGRQTTVGDMVTRAYRYAGLLHVSQTPDTSQATFGRELLEDVLDSLPAEGEFARAVDFYEYTLTAAEVTAETYKLTMGSEVLDLLDPAMYIPADESDTDRADGETVMRLISIEEWHRYGAKSPTGTPTRFMPYRVNDTLQAWVWPIPSEAGTIRFKIHRKATDADTDNVTMDLQNYWMDFVKKRLAADLANSHSLPKSSVAYLDSQAREALQKAKGKANQRPGFQIHMTHKGPYG